jgi:hypothetical protein
MRAFLEYLHDWIGESGYYYDPRLLLPSPLLWAESILEQRERGAAFGPPFLFDSGNGVVRGFFFQKVPNCDWHGPRSHINRVGPIKTTDQVPAEIVTGTYHGPEAHMRRRLAAG